LISQKKLTLEKKMAKMTLLKPQEGESEEDFRMRVTKALAAAGLLTKEDQATLEADASATAV
jgi:hypothetical protein